IRGYEGEMWVSGCRDSSGGGCRGGWRRSWLSVESLLERPELVGFLWGEFGVAGDVCQNFAVGDVLLFRTTTTQHSFLNFRTELSPYSLNFGAGLAIKESTLE